MKLSIKKQTALYTSIHDPIMDLRVELKMKGCSKKDVDDSLFGLTEKIYREIRKSLNIER